jgi:ribosomal protein L7/L12
MSNILDANDIEHKMLRNMVKSLEEKFDISNRATRTQISSEFEVVNIRLDNIDEKSETALSKIANLEKDTDFIRVIKRYKKATFLALVGLIAIANSKQIIIWFNAFKDKINIFNW